MPKKNRSIALSTEVLPPVHTTAIPDMRGMLNSLVEQKVAEIMERDSGVQFQPYFQSRAVATEIRRNQTVGERNKWSYYFEKYGCDVCGTKERGHNALGRCAACFRRTSQRLEQIMRQIAKEKRGTVPVARDLGDLARESLRSEMRALPAAPKRKTSRRA